MFGLPGLPFADCLSYQSADVYCDLVFLDYTGTPVIPSSFTWQLDDISNATSMIGAQTVSGPPAAEYTLQIPGTSMNMTHEWQGSQLCQLSFTFSAVDSVQGNNFVGRGVAVIELVSIQTPFGGS
jgi:hypothetical protein